ncbi:MAG: MmgE/PrpD family protein [Thermaerobacterales bacterium]
MSRPYTLQKLADWVHDFDFDDIPAASVEKTGTLITDSVACAIGGSATREGRIFLGLAPYLGAGGPLTASLMNGGDQAGLLGAVHINAMLANVLDYDDTSFGHPGAVAVQTGLAVGEALNKSGREVLTAIVAGYETAGRLMSGLSPSARQRTKVVGQGTVFALAAAAVAGKLMGLSGETVAQAMAVAACNAPVPSVNKAVYGAGGPTPCKNNMGAAAEAGVTAALLAGNGFNGPLDILEGPSGFSAMMNSDRQDLEQITAGMGGPLHVDRVALKPWPCCKFIHGPIDAVQMALEKAGAAPADVDEISIRTFTWVARYPFTVTAPANMAEAQYSLCYALSCAVLGIEPGSQWFDERALSNPAVLELSKKIHLIPEPEADNTAYQRSAYARCEMKVGGRTVTVDRYSARGDDDHPMTPADLEIKHTGLLKDGGLNGPAAGRTLDKLRALHLLPEIKGLWRAS